MKVLILNGPNLNLLGKREPGIYGVFTLQDINGLLTELAAELKVDLEFYQSNCEGDLVNRLHQADFDVQAVVFNPGAFTHYSLALTDAVKAISIPVIEVHLSNIYAREEFRQKSVIAPAAAGQISGLGVESYLLGLRAAVRIVEKGRENAGVKG